MRGREGNAKDDEAVDREVAARQAGRRLDRLVHSASRAEDALQSALTTDRPMARVLAARTLLELERRLIREAELHEEIDLLREQLRRERAERGAEPKLAEGTSPEG